MRTRWLKNEHCKDVCQAGTICMTRSLWPVTTMAFFLGKMQPELRNWRETRPPTSHWHPSRHCLPCTTNRDERIFISQSLHRRTSLVCPGTTKTLICQIFRLHFLSSHRFSMKHYYRRTCSQSACWPHSCGKPALDAFLVFGPGSENENESPSARSLPGVCFGSWHWIVRVCAFRRVRNLKENNIDAGKNTHSQKLTVSLPCVTTGTDILEHQVSLLGVFFCD